MINPKTITATILILMIGVFTYRHLTAGAPDPIEPIHPVLLAGGQLQVWFEDEPGEAADTSVYKDQRLPTKVYRDEHKDLWIMAQEVRFPEGQLEQEFDTLFELVKENDLQGMKGRINNELGCELAGIQGEGYMIYNANSNRQQVACVIAYQDYLIKVSTVYERQQDSDELIMRSNAIFKSVTQTPKN